MDILQTVLEIKTTALMLWLGLAATSMAQQPVHQPDPTRQRVAMQKLSFLIGSWSGEAHVQWGPGVHLQPEVPASVLPLGIKQPVIPVVVLLLGLLTAFDVWKQLRVEQA